MVRILWIFILGCLGTSLLTTGFRFFCMNYEESVENIYVEGVDRPYCNCYGQMDNKTVFDWTFVHDNGRFDHIATCYGVDNCTSSYPSAVLQADLNYGYSSVSFRNLTTHFSGVITCTQTNATSRESANYTLKVTRVRFEGCSEGLNFLDGIDEDSISCTHSPYAPNTVTWTLITVHGQLVHLGNCSGFKNFKYNCTSLLSPNATLDSGSTSTDVFFSNDFLNRDIAGATCSVAFRDYTDMANCTLDIYSPAILENCSMEIGHHNWSFDVSCDVTNVFSSQGHYLFWMSEDFNILQNGNLMEAGSDSFVGFRSFRDYLLPYKNSTDNKEYYRGRVRLSWPIAPFPGTYNSFTVKTYHGSEREIDFEGGFNVSLPTIPSHNCSDITTPCSCRTESLGSPAGRLLWLSGNTTVAIGDYGVKELLLPSDDLTDGQDVIVATCELDWIQTLTGQQPAIFRRTDADKFKVLTAVGWTMMSVAAVLVAICVILMYRGRFRRWSRELHEN